MWSPTHTLWYSLLCKLTATAWHEELTSSSAKHYSWSKLSLILSNFCTCALSHLLLFPPLSKPSNIKNSIHIIKKNNFNKAIWEARKTRRIIVIIIVMSTKRRKNSKHLENCSSVYQFSCNEVTQPPNNIRHVNK